MMNTDPEAYKTIKVPAWVYINAKEAELALMRKGVSRLPNSVLQPTKCPICKADLNVRKIDDTGKEYLHCPNCGYTQPKFEGSMEGVALGTAIGMGLVHLLNTLFGNGHQTKPEVGTG